jgi:hypothetical protein
VPAPQLLFGLVSRIPLPQKEERDCFLPSFFLESSNLYKKRVSLRSINIGPLNNSDYVCDTIARVEYGNSGKGKSVFVHQIHMKLLPPTKKSGGENNSGRDEPTLLSKFVCSVSNFSFFLLYCNLSHSHSEQRFCFRRRLLHAQQQFFRRRQEDI